MMDSSIINKSTDIELNIFCDGGARGNPGPAAIGFVVKDGQGKLIHQEARTIGETTNNVAEYQAVIAALEWLVNNKDSRHSGLSVRLFLDSRLVANQLNGAFKVKDIKLRNLILIVKGLEKTAKLTIGTKGSLFPQERNNIFYQTIPRELNAEADGLVNSALDKLSLLQ